jgi:hypothetical protein
MTDTILDEFQIFIPDLEIEIGFYNGIHVQEGENRLIRASYRF